MNNINIFSFFSGAGFLDLGFETNGYKIKFVNEIHKPFAGIYAHAREQMGISLPDVFSHDSAAELIDSPSFIELVKATRRTSDAIGFIAGPPCPDFSVAGKNAGSSGAKGQLSQVYIDLVCKHQPDFFVFENAKGLLSTRKHRLFYGRLKIQLEQAGYILTDRVVNALAYGAPQHRERVFLIGFRKACFANYLTMNRLYKFWHTPLNVYKIMAMDWPTTEPFCENGKRLPLPNTNLDLTVNRWFLRNTVDRHINNRQHFVPKSDKFKTVEEGDVSRKFFKRLHRWRYSPTAAYGNNEVHLHPYRPRRLSVSEALAIQSLPASFTLPLDITLSNAFKAIGNGVPYLVAAEIARQIELIVNSE